MALATSGCMMPPLTRVDGPGGVDNGEHPKAVLNRLIWVVGCCWHMGPHGGRRVVSTASFCERLYLGFPSLPLANGRAYTMTDIDRRAKTTQGVSATATLVGVSRSRIVVVIGQRAFWVSPPITIVCRHSLTARDTPMFRSSRHCRRFIRNVTRYGGSFCLLSPPVGRRRSSAV